MSHEHCKAGEVGAGAAGVCAIGGEQSAVLRGPESRHGALGVAPKRAVGIEILFWVLQEEKDRERDCNQEKPRQTGPNWETRNKKGSGRMMAENIYLSAKRWEVETWSGKDSQKGREKKDVRKWWERKDGEEVWQTGSPAHAPTQQQTEGTECKSETTNKHGAVAGGDGAAAVIVVYVLWCSSGSCCVNHGRACYVYKVAFEKRKRGFLRCQTSWVTNWKRICLLNEETKWNCGADRRIKTIWGNMGSRLLSQMFKHFIC